MGLIKWLKAKSRGEKIPKTITERRSKIQAILGPLVLQKIIDSKQTLSYITEILVNMGDPELEQKAIMVIVGIMAELGNESRKEFILAVGMALLVAYGTDTASKLINEISAELLPAVNS